ncbi:MAG: hypothetical protein J0M02_00735 [Planctomycetes bacterium]|nr:hypothetical protein [Planctomycetota bacterium]
MRALLHLDGVAWRHELRIDGAAFGSSNLGLVPHTYDITERMVPGDHTIAIAATARWALWDQGQRSFTAPIGGTMPGISDRVWIELVPEVRIDDIFVRPLTSQHRIEVEVSIASAAASPRRVIPVVTVRDPEGMVRLSITGGEVEIPPGGTATANLAADWTEGGWWSPAAPVLHRAEVRLDADGRSIDRQSTGFGYRSFTASGTDFQLNGRRQVLLRNSWLRSPTEPRDEVIPWLRDELRNSNCIRLHLGQNNPAVIDQCDRMGMLVIPEFWGWYQNDDKRFPIAQANAWTPATLETMRRLVRRWRNHPSVIMYSVTNETMWNSTTPERMAVAEQVVRTIRGADPTRLLQGDGEVTWDGRLDAISIHYPEGDAGTVGKRYDNSGWVVPNDLDWLRRNGTNHAWRADFMWDRPLMLGEFYCPEPGVSDRYAPFSGDAAYDESAWRWTDFGGRNAPTTAPSPWIEMVKLSSDHYRAAGVACLNPWTGQGFQTMPQLLVAPLDHFPNAFAGETCTRRFVVANDHHQAWNDLHLQAGLFIGARAVWSTERIPVPWAPGESRQLDIDMAVPRLASPAAVKLIVRLRWMRGRQAIELARHEEDMWVLPRPTLSDVDAIGIALVDKEGVTAKALEAMGLRLAPGACDDRSLVGKRLLVIGEGAAEQADLAAAARFAESGGQVLVLHQTRIGLLAAGQPEIDPRHAASFSWSQSRDPLLAGFDDRQLRFWRPDHLVATETLVRPASAAAIGTAVCGGRYGMHWSPLAEQRHGRGGITWCQYLLAERSAVEPVAAEILARAVRRGVAATPTDPPPALRLIGVAAPARAVLIAAGVRISDEAAGGGPAMLDLGAGIPDREMLQRLRTEVEAGGTLWLRGLDSGTLSAATALLPWQPRLVPLPAGRVGAAVRIRDPLADGIGTADLYWAREGASTASLGGPGIEAPVADHAVAITDPPLLVAVPLGRGRILIDQLAWDRAAAAEPERIARIAGCLAHNIGAGGEIRSARAYRFRHVDLARFANRGFVDDRMGDGVGGWTDQGDNDLRYFLVNHTGIVGGMAVAGQAFPASANLAGVDFGLVDPAANHGRSVLTFRAEGHDPTALDAVRGIPVGAKADRIWFLHTGAWSSSGGRGRLVARYDIVYSDGSRASADVRQGQEIADWWHPEPLPGAAVAWTGRNDRHAPIGLYSMPWDNPHPEREIASIDVIGGLAQTQLVLVSITLGEVVGAKPAAAWDLGVGDARGVPALVGDQALGGEAEIVELDGRNGRRFGAGRQLDGTLPATPLAEGKPVAIEIDAAALGPPAGAYGGLIEAGTYQARGLRIMVDRNLRVVVEQWAGPEGTRNLIATDPLVVNRMVTIRYENDGNQARLLIDGRIQAAKACAPPQWDGRIRIGRASGKDYWFEGIIAGIRILPAP